MNDDRKYWLDEPRNVDKIAYALYALCAALVVVDWFHEREIHESWFARYESWFGFYGWFGFVACVGLVLAAKLIRIGLRRGEDYYDQ